MVLGTVSGLRETINEYRQSIYELTKKKGISDPHVIRISQRLDGKIIMLQKNMYHPQPLSTAQSFYHDENQIEPGNITHSK